MSNVFDQFDKSSAPEQFGPPAPERTWWDTAKSVGQTADDAVRAAANAVTFGMADRFAGWASGTGTDEQVRLSQEARERSPVASVAGDVGGAVALPGIGGRQLAARYGSGLLARAAGYGAEGAAIGAAQGAGQTYTGNVEDYAKNALMGGVLGGVGGALIGGAIGPRAPVSTAQRPTAAQARTATDLAYDALRNNPTPYSSRALSQYADRLERHLQNEGYINVPGYSPASFRAVERMRDTGQPTVTAADIDLIRRGINQIPRGDAAATDRSSGRIVKDWLDDFIANPPPGALGPGATQAEARQAARTANVARESRQAQQRIGMIEGVKERAAQLAQQSNSGRNVDNLIRSTTSNYFLNPLSRPAQQRLSAFNRAEQAALRNIPDPKNRFHDAIRFFGNIGGGGGGIATPMLAIGGSVAGGALSNDDRMRGALMGLGLAGGGLGLRSMANRFGRERINAAERLIAERSPLYRHRLATAPTRTPGASPTMTRGARDALTLQLLEAQGVPRITVTPREEE